MAIEVSSLAQSASYLSSSKGHFSILSYMNIACPFVAFLRALKVPLKTTRMYKESQGNNMSLPDGF